MNKTVNKYLLAGDKFMPQTHLKEPGLPFTKNKERIHLPFTKNKERIQKFKETGDTKYIYKNDMTYGDFKDLAERTAAEKVLKYKSFNIAKDLNMMNIKED